jgi:zinc finger protein
VHASGAISGHGTKTTLHVKQPLDMTRSFLKSETATISIPELHLELGTGTLGSKFTTVEGILDSIVEALNKNPFALGDSADKTARTRFHDFTIALTKLKTGATPFTLIVDDPMSNSYIQNPLVPEPDPQLEIVQYDLTWEQKEELGINDMRTEFDAESQAYLAPSVQHHGHRTQHLPATTTTATTEAASAPAPPTTSEEPPKP